MKKILALVFLYSTSSFAGGYYEPRIGVYDPITGIFYKSVIGTRDRGGLLGSKALTTININIFDPKTGQSTLLFKEPQNDGISVVLYESGYKEGALEYGGTAHSSVVLNNIGVVKRETKDKLLVGVQGENELILFVSSKSGNDLKKLTVVPASADWHLDARNSAVRVVHQTGGAVHIESFEW